MKRQFLLAAWFVGMVSGCLSTDSAPETGGVRPTYGKSFGPPMVPGVQGPYGTPVPMAGPYNMAPPSSQATALDMMSKNVPLNFVQQHPSGMPMGGPPGMAMPNRMMPPNMISPPGVPAGPGMPGGMPGMPGGMMSGGMPGGMPGGGMPGMPPGMPGGMPPMGNPVLKPNLENMMPDAGIMNANIPPGVRQPNGVLPTQFAASSPVGSMFPAQRTQVYFGSPVRMKVYWFTQGANGKPNYMPDPLETPGRYNFAQGAIYRLKLTNIPGRPALELYPTLEVVPTGPKTNEFLAHNSVPLDFTEEDFKQVVDRNYIVKVIYLPDPQFQDAAGAGPGEINSTQLEPGQDPIQEALRRGSILLVLRIGNIDQGLVSSPPMTAPIPSGPPMMMKPPFMGVPPNVQVPMNITPITPGFTPNGAPPGPIPPGAFGPGVGTNPNVAPPLLNMPNLLIPPQPNAPVVPPKADASKVPLLPPPPGLEAKPFDLVPLPAPPGLAPLAPPGVEVNKEKQGIVPIPLPPTIGPKDVPAPALVPVPSVVAPPTVPAKEVNNPTAFPIPPNVGPAPIAPATRPVDVPTTTPAVGSERPALPPIRPIPDLPEEK